MLYDIALLVRGRVDSLRLDGDFDIQRIKHMELEYELDSPVHIEGKIIRAGNELLLDCRISFFYKDSCARCLKAMRVHLDYDFSCLLVNERLVDEMLESEEDILYYTKDSIDISELVDLSLEFNMPARVLCTEDCLGFCPGCGADLNVEACTCEADDEDEEETIDPRFAKLKELFKE